MMRRLIPTLMLRWQRASGVESSASFAIRFALSCFGILELLVFDWKRMIEWLVRTGVLFQMTHFSGCITPTC
ncbi:hypothetical protein Y032_0045g1234 [Ancylostoma ceylanicum]|uniref:Uncharacterized protein n=1 Tax=Ancylostoma ceylanicum TaxID=53326 RepID=A0A016UD58_9BILA|nr:hypothetical protein Y032_0045g1234 [Ancylostoma ceylanicum]